MSERSISVHGRCAAARAGGSGKIESIVAGWFDEEALPFVMLRSIVVSGWRCNSS